MSLSLAVALILIADLALIAGVVYVMSRAARLTPHVPANAATDLQRRAGFARRSAGRVARRVDGPLAAARS